MRHTTLHQRGFAVRYLTLSVGETFSKACVMVAFGYLARVLTPAGYGIVEQALAITVFFVLGVESGMGLYGARVVAAAPERVPRLISQVMTLRAVLGVPAFVAVLVVAAHYRMAGLGIVAVNGLAILLTPFMTQWVFQGLRQMSWVAGGAVARNLTFVALIFALIRPGSELWLVAVAEVSGIFVLAIVNAWFLYGKLHVRLDTTGNVAGVRALFGDVWFMGFSDLMWACLWYSPAVAVGWVSTGGSEQVAWVGAAVRIVLAVQVFVYLYFYNLLPSLASELAEGTHGWRRLMQRSIGTSLWPACLIALGGTLFAPILIPAVYGPAFSAAIVPFQIAIWMIPAAWFNGHFRFSLVAAGQQWWEFLVAIGTAVVTITAGLVLSYHYGSIGAASALLVGGITNTILAAAAANRRVGSVPVLSSAGPALLAVAVSLALGAGISVAAGPLSGTVAGCLLFVIVGARQDNELVRLVRSWIGATP
ncbi:MAG: oligosaccharide flippase family protein, partial [Vicinamibacterales bacterium]